MRKFLFTIVAVLSAISFINGQVLVEGEPVPTGAVIYSLPSTTIGVKVVAECEQFVAGPYAQFAQKYLGVEAGLKDKTTYRLKSVELLPYIEADENISAAINLTSKTAAANFLNFCSQGLILFSDNFSSAPMQKRFINGPGKELFNNGITSNIANISTTLYKSVKTAEGLGKVAVSQEQSVAKSLEQKAAEAAELLFRLKQKRIDIITGDTDATFSGEAMGAVLKEIASLEEEYLSMFLGKTEYKEQEACYDVVPLASNASQVYIAFKLSDSKGLLPGNSIEGKPYIIELAAASGVFNPTPISEAQFNTKGRVAYRRPATAIVRLTDGKAPLTQTRMAIYQLGKIVSFPIETLIK